MSDLRGRLSHVLWIGGAPCAGKSTLARILAGRYDLAVYDADRHHAREHQTRPGGRPSYWAGLSMDERWLLPSPAELAERDVRAWSARFPLVARDLLARPRTRPIVAEGPSLFPWCVAPVLGSPRQAIFLIPSPAWRDRVLERRRSRGEVRFEDRTSDPERARRNVRERELLITARIVAACEELGLRRLHVDGSQDLRESLAVLEEHFRPGLPEAPNV